MNSKTRNKLHEEFISCVKNKRGYGNNYFLTDIFNYYFLSDFEEFSVYQIKEIWKKYIRRLKTFDTTNEIVNLFVWVPYCRQRCNYCIYHSGVPENGLELDKYIENISELVRYYSDVFIDFEFNSLYIWWGTPSILSAAQLEKLLSSLNNFLTIKQWSERSMECNPDSTTLEKLEIVKKYWINRISFWIQSLNSNVLESINRWYQTKEQVIKSVSWASECEFNEISCDIIFGLPLDSPEGFISMFCFLLEAWITKLKLYWV